VTDAANLFDPFTSRGVRLRNRIGVSPMCQYCCEPDGRATDWHLAHLVARGIGGAGLVLTEAAAVSPEGRITGRDLGLWSDDQLPGHARLAEAIGRTGAVPGTQIAHAGRKASQNPPWVGGVDRDGWQPIGPSALAQEEMLEPRAMSEGDIAGVIADFVAAARRAVRAGYRVIELHAAHGYLLHQFLSPLSNTRNDGWGGDFDGRARLALEVCAAVRAAIPDDVSLWARLSHTDWLPGGWDTAGSVELSRRLRALGADVIDASSGGIAASAPIPVGPGYQVPGAEAIRRGADVPVAAVGMLGEPELAQSVIAEGRADLVLLARVLLREPNWPLRAAEALGATERLEAPPQYARAWGRVPVRDATAEPFAPL